ncbi:MAG: alpha-glucosidase [Gaiellaceae bacterium]|nr:alpha-glucosidase [Gaiellaceae bacterium]
MSLAPARAVDRLLMQPHHDGSELHILERPEELGGEATVRLRAARGAADHVLLRYDRDGEPRTIAATVDEETEEETWWRATFPVVNPSTPYRFLLSGGTTGYGWLTGNGVYPHEVPSSDDFVLALGDGPAWHLESVAYEIFPDRFARSGATHTPPDWVAPRAWHELPTGRGPATPYEWYGGDLPGIEAHLDHVELLGANVIYLTPFFPAGSTHRYDASSFDHVDALLGGDVAFESLTRAMHARGMRLIGDLTLNHTGRHHEWFNVAQADPHATERSFYYFDESLPHGYESWLGVPSLPKLDWRADDLRGRMGGVLRHWLDNGLDAWRIDVANMTGRFRAIDLNHEVARWARETADGALVLAEHGHDFRPDLDGTGWHGVMNYAGFLKPTWWWLRGDEIDHDAFSAAPAPRYDGAELVSVMRRFRTGVPWQTVSHSWTLLDSHDTARFSHVVGGSRARQHVGVGLMMTTPGVPMIYAGDELGLGGAWGEDGRRTMPWDDEAAWPADTLAAYRELGALRRTSDALAHGGIRYLHVSDDAVAYLRETRSERLLCLASRADHPPLLNPFPELETLYGEDASDTLPAHGPAFHIWRIR